MMLQQLEYLGIHGLPHQCVASYPTNREQCVEIEKKTCSDNIYILHRVPQGSVVGPILFLMYVDNLHSSILNGDVLQFVDDKNLH